MKGLLELQHDVSHIDGRGEERAGPFAQPVLHVGLARPIQCTGDARNEEFRGEHDISKAGARGVWMNRRSVQGPSALSSARGVHMTAAFRSEALAGQVHARDPAQRWTVIGFARGTMAAENESAQ